MTHQLSRHHPHMRYLAHKDLGALYWSVFIKGIGDSFISIFTAIYLLHIGLGFRSVCIYYIVYFLCSGIIMNRPAMMLCHGWGIRKTLALGIIGFIAYYFLLSMVAHGLPYVLVAVTYGTAASLYYSAFQLDLLQAMRRNQAGKSLSTIRILTILAGVAGPVIGAAFIVNLSFMYLFLLVAGILLCSVVPLLRRGDHRIDRPVPSVADSLSSEAPQKGLMYLLYGITESALDILWPVFLFMQYKNLLSIGGIVSLTSLLMVGVLFAAGRYSDRNPAKAYQLGILLYAPSWILRVLLLTPFGLLASNFLGSASSSLVGISVDQVMYHDAKTAPNPAAHLLFRSYFAACGRIGILLVAGAFNSMVGVFILVAAFTFAQLIFLPHKNRHLAYFYSRNH